MQDVIYFSRSQIRNKETLGTEVKCRSEITKGVKNKMHKYLNALETISNILRSNDSDAAKLKLIGDAVDEVNNF